MNNIQSTFSKKTMKKWIILFSIILIVFNVMLFTLINIQYRLEVKREYQSLSELISHLAYYEDHEVIRSYLEHYEHTQDVKVVFHDHQHEIIYQSVDIKGNLNPLYYDEVMVGYLGVDYQTSLLGKDYGVLFLIMNGLMMLILTSLLIFFYQQNQKQAALWITELSRVDDEKDDFQIEEIRKVHVLFKEAIKREKDAQQTYEMHIKRLAHDIKTPLTASLLILEAIEKKRIPADDKFIHEVMTELHQVNQLIPQFISKNSQEIALVQDISLLVIDYVKRYQDVFLTKDINVVLALESLFTYISKVDFITIFEHLIFNAFYYSEPHKTISIETNTKEKILIIKDEGLGMTDSEIEILMKQRFRGDKAQKFHRSGSGMGYMIIIELLNKVHAKIKIESELNKGTTIRIYFQ